MHLIVDGYSSNIGVLTDPYSLRIFIRDLVRKGKMRLMGEITVQGYPHPSKLGSQAYSAFAPLAESSIVIHTYPEHSFIYLDVFHCAGFDVYSLFDWIEEELELDKPKTLLLDRGIDSMGTPIETSEIEKQNLVGV